MKTSSVVNRKVQFAFGSAILALLLVGTISYRSMLASSESDQWVQHTYEVLEGLNSLVAAIESVESSYRGFALTGDESHFDSYRYSIENAAQAERIVRNLTADNPVRQLQLSALERVIAEKIHFDDTVIELRRTRGLEAAGNALRNGSGQRIMDQFQAMVHSIQNEELRLLSLRNADAKHRLEQTRIFLFLGTVLGLLIAFGAGWSAQSDHSAREAAENDRREGEERFVNVANNISQLAWMADDNFSVFWYNDRWFEYCGTTPEELAGLGWKKVVHPDHLDRVVEELNRCFLSGETWEDTFPIRGKDGSYRMFLGRAVPIRDAEGKMLRWVGTDTDITESQAMKEELFAEKERAQVTLNSIGDAVICADLAGNISFLNPVAEEMTGWSLQDATGRPTPDVLRIVDATSRVAIPNPMSRQLSRTVLRT
jgi:PAS domain S-box-containing protein